MIITIVFQQPSTLIMPYACTIELRVWMTTNCLVSGGSQGHKDKDKMAEKSDRSG